MKYLSLFSGIGGFEVGINKAYENLKSGRVVERSVGSALQPNGDLPDALYDRRRNRNEYAACVGFSEIDKHASSVYQRNFPGHNALGDITKIDAEVLPDFDLLVGGFPCQAFSIAGKRLGFEDTRGTLFFEIARILAVKRPKNFVLENVRGLLSHDGGRTFRTILSAINDLGYGVEWQVLNSKDFGVPQNRERVYIVGHLGGLPGRKVFPLCGSDGACDEDAEPECRQRINVVNKVGRAHDGTEMYIRKRENISGTLKASNQSNIRSAGSALVEIVQDVRGLDKKQNGKGWKEDSTSYTVNTIERQGISDGYRIRRLTPTECERLQAFPDNWTATYHDGKPVSDTQRYKMCGNAVTTSVVEAVVSNLCYNNVIEDKETDDIQASEAPLA
jgi:DNA (cytosine-5)-methyltransferase 1